MKFSEYVQLQEAELDESLLDTYQVGDTAYIYKGPHFYKEMRVSKVSKGTMECEDGDEILQFMFNGKGIDKGRLTVYRLGDKPE